MKKNSTAQPAAWIEFLSQATDFLSAIKRGGVKLSNEQISRALALDSMIKENEILKSKGRPEFDLKAGLRDEQIARSCFIRAMDWTTARQSQLLYARDKNCPPDGNEQLNDANFFGRVLNADDTGPELLEFLGREYDKLPEAAKKAFKKSVANPRKAVWKNPELDLWLICIWPVVEKYGWTYRDIWKVAVEKFNESGDKALNNKLDSADSVSDHCKKTLGLKIAPSKGGRVRRAQESELPFMHELALQILTELPANYI